MLVGDGPRARGLLGEVLAREATGPRRADALHKLAYLVTDDSALSLAEQASAELEEEDAALLAEISISASMFAVMSGGMATALGHAQDAIRRAESSGQPFLLSQALSTTAFLRHLAGGGLQRELLLRAAALEREAGGHPGDYTPLEILGMQFATWSAKLAQARELLIGERDRAHASGYLDHAQPSPMLLAELEVRAGRWQLAEQYARQTLELSLGSDMWNAEAAGHWTRALVDAHFGRVDAARADAETGRSQAEQLGDLAFATRCSHVLGFVALSLGDAEAAVRHLGPLQRHEQRRAGRAGDVLHRARPRRGAGAGGGSGRRARGAGRARGPGAEARADLGGRHGAALPGPDRRGRGQPGSRVGGSPGGGRAARRGPAAVRSRRADAARARNRAAAGEATGGGARDAGSRAGGLLRGARRRGCGQTAGARAEIARLGGRRAKDPDELTETERRIAELAADGRSNREIAGELFVSERTVEANLTRAYRKLGSALAHGARAPAAHRVATPRRLPAPRARALRPSAAGRPEPWPAPARPRRRATGEAPAGRRGVREAVRGCAPTLFHVAVLLVEDGAGERPVEDAAQCVDVGAGVDVDALRLLGRHVVGGADREPGLREVGAATRSMVIPKSVRKAYSSPSRVAIRTLPGLTSRWTSPWRWASVRAAATCATILTARDGSSRSSSASSDRRSVPSM